MPTTFGVNANNDLYIGEDGNLVILTGIEALKQIIQQATQTRINEMVLRINDGIPFLESVWAGVPNLQQFKGALRSTILAVEGVTGIKSLDVARIGDVLTYTAVINTIYGQVVSNV